MHIRGFNKFGIKVLWRLQFLEYFRTLCLKFQKARTKIEIVLSLPCWLSQQTANMADSGKLQFWSEPSEILNLRSSNTPETVAFTIPYKFLFFWQISFTNFLYEKIFKNCHFEGKKWYHCSVCFLKQLGSFFKRVFCHIDFILSGMHPC